MRSHISTSVFKRGAVLFLLHLLAASVTAAPIGLTPLAVSPGTPAGTYSLTGFENINLYNGQLNFALPLLPIGGRGKVGYTMTLAMSQRVMVYNSPIDRCDAGLCESGCTSGSCGSYFLKNLGTPLGSFYVPYLAPGRLWGNREGTFQRHPTFHTINYVASLSRFVFSLPDGTELELRDKNTNGKVYEAGAEAPTGFARGSEFVTADGTSATFVSDIPIVDLRPGSVSPPVPYCNYSNCNTMTTPSGYLVLADGTRYEISQGEVTRMLDSNGNQINFAYTTYTINNASGSSIFRGLSQVTDALGRIVTISYGVVTGNGYDEITFKGASDVDRHIRLFRTATDTSASAKPTSVELPNGKSYTLSYNSRGELSRIDLPTGGAIEYTFEGGIQGGDSEGYFGGNINEFQSTQETFIYRRLVQRRVYEAGQLKNITTYSKSDTTSSTFPFAAPLPYIEVNQYAATSTDCLASQTCQLLARDRHFFRYTAAQSYSGSTQLNQFKFNRYPRWDEGTEWKTQRFAADGVAILRQEEFNYSQTYVDWWTGPNMGVSNQPRNNPRLVETLTTLPESNQVMKRSAINPVTGAVGFDQYNNQTDVWTYDYGNGNPGALLQHQHTEFEASPSYTSATVGSHLKKLPLTQQTFAIDSNGAESLAAHSTTTYDEGMVTNYGVAVSGWLDPGSRPRGNATSISVWRDRSGGNPDILNTWLHTHAAFDQCGNVVSTTDGLNGLTTRSYADAFSDGNNSRNTFAFPTSTTSPDPDGNGPLGPITTTNEYDFSIGTVSQSTDANLLKTTFSYNDPLDRIKQVVRAAGDLSLQNQTSYNYDDNAMAVTTTSDLNTYNDNAIKVVTFHDGMGRPTETHTYESSTEYITRRQEYDAAGRTTRAHNPYRTINDETYGWTDTTYDTLSRVTRVEMFDHAGVSTGAVQTDYQGMLTLVTDQAGKKRLSKTNALTQLTDVWEITDQPPTVTVTFAGQQLAGYLTHYDYHVLGGLERVTQASQTPRTFGYNSLNQLVSTNNPESGLTTYDYDDNGNLAHTKDARLITTTHVYDGLNRIVSRNYSDNTPDVSYSYDVNAPNAKGRLVSVSSSISSHSCGSYDLLGNVVSETQTIEGIAYPMFYAYNRAGHLVQETYPSGRIVRTEYDRAGRIAGVKQQSSEYGYYIGGSSLDANNRLHYSPAGAVTEARLGNYLWEHTDYNSRLQVTEIKLGDTVDNSKRLRLQYSYGAANNNGNLQSQTISAPGNPTLTQTYSYDQLNRLETAQEMNGVTESWKQRYTYDRFGNRNFDTLNTNIPSALTNLAISPANNRLDTAAPGQSLIEYDDAGNLTRDAAGSTYAYDAEQRLMSYNGGNPATGGAGYSYDGLGHRVKKVASTGTTIFVYDLANRLIAEYATTQPAATGTNYFTLDHLGTPRVITGVGGTVMARHDYLPFGEEVPTGYGGRSTGQGYVSDDVKQKFTSKERDNETSLDYFGARYYASTQGRFTSPDAPFADQSADTPQSWNLYSYVRNNPLVIVDPTGRFGDYYYRDGVWCYSDLINDGLVYVLNETHEADGSTNLTPQLLRGITHREFKIIANIVRQEGATTDPQEYLWIAHSSNNEAVATNTTLFALLQTRFSTAGDKTTGLSTNSITVQANAARAGEIDVLSGGADPTGGARRWDGVDFIAWGLNGPYGPHAKFREYSSIDIPSATYNTYLAAQTAEFGNSVSFSGVRYTLPAAVFTNQANWVNNNFHYVTNARHAAHSITATGARGQSIFWRF